VAGELSVGFAGLGFGRNLGRQIVCFAGYFLDFGPKSLKTGGVRLSAVPLLFYASFFVSPD
jgi:hypothetical protein